MDRDIIFIMYQGENKYLSYYNLLHVYKFLYLVGFFVFYSATPMLFTSFVQKLSFVGEAIHC